MKIDFMIRKLGFLILSFVIISCSEGDIIETSVDFEGELENCSNQNDDTFVFYIIDEDMSRSLSINFTSSSFEIDPMMIEDISLDEPTVISLNTSSNQFLYREFDTAINGTDYFCNSIPPSDINVTLELTSSNGTAEISYALMTMEPTQNIYSRTVTLRDITLEGNGIAIRKKELVLGSDTVQIPN